MQSEHHLHNRVGTLHTLLQQAYCNDFTPYDGNTTQPDEEVFDEWGTQQTNVNAHFNNWFKTKTSQENKYNLQESNIKFKVLL